MEAERILEHLDKHGAVLTGSHFVYTNGGHGTAYVNMKAVAHQSVWLSDVARALAGRLQCYALDAVVGPETLGRSLAEKTAPWCTPGTGIWCNVDEVNGHKVASFSQKLGFEHLLPGMRVAIVDDLLTTGSSIEAVSRLVTETGGKVVAAAVVVRRTPDVTAEHCGVPALQVLAEVSGFALYTPEECLASGPCSQEVPVRLRPGHGWKWAESHPDYPTV